MLTLAKVSDLSNLPQQNFVLPSVMGKDGFSLVSGVLSAEKIENVARAFVEFQQEVGGTVTAFSEAVAQELLTRNMLFRVLNADEMIRIQNGERIELQCGFSIIPFPLHVIKQRFDVREQIRLSRFGSLGVRMKQLNYQGDDNRKNAKDRRSGHSEVNEAIVTLDTIVQAKDNRLAVMRERLLADRRGFGNDNWKYVFGLVSAFQELQKLPPFSGMEYLLHTNDSQENFARRYKFLRFTEIMEALFQKACNQYHIELDAITSEQRKLFCELAKQKLVTVYRYLDLGYSHDSPIHADRDGTGLMDYWIRFCNEEVAMQLFGSILKQFLLHKNIIQQNSCVSDRKVS